MSDVAHPFRQHKIVILNPKGGSGKTTLATNLASCFARRGPPPTLIDCDPGGYSMRWIDKRPATCPPVYGTAHFDDVPAADSHACQFSDSREVIVDLPAALSLDEIFDHVYDASSILIPVVPSEIDIYSAARFIADLLLITQLDRSKRNLAIVANRVRERTRSYRMLRRFLASLQIPVIARLRDSQNYVHAASQGIGVAELPAYRARQDVEQLESVTDWLDRWRSRELDALIAKEMSRQRADRVAAGNALPIH
jgi:chromosome partitioning protein